MTNPDELARFRDEQGRKWLLIYTAGNALEMWRLNKDGSRDGPHQWDDVTGRHRLTRLYPPPGDLG